MKFGCDLFTPLGGLFLNIHFLHLDQSSVENFISNLTYRHACPFRHGHKGSFDVGVIFNESK